MEKNLTKIPKVIKSFQIPNSIFNQTLDQLRKIGNQHKEGIAYWTGVLNDSNAVIRNVIFADEYVEFHNDKLFARVPLTGVFKIGEKIHQLNEILFAQIHTHPMEAFHSYVDSTSPISHRLGFISIVIPYFGNKIDSLLQCKVYEYKGKASWNLFNEDQLLKKFQIIGDDS